MKLRTRKKSNKPVKIQQPKCFNCGHPFSGHEKFCPECGQKNKDKRITFGEFIHEIFNGFISWDSKFWTTIIPLLTNPGKVSRDYIDGKRMRYTNPFRFYLTVSVVFFLIIGITESYNKFNELRKGKTKSATSINAKIDSVTKAINTNPDKIKTTVNEALKALDSTEREEVIKTIPTINPSTWKNKTKNENNIQLGFFPDANKFYHFQKKHPNIEIETALDSLGVEHSFTNRFMYSRFQAVNKIFDNKENEKQFQKQLISYISISLFIFLPLFTLFLKFFYIRRKFTYVEHLIFVFHTQTVFFLLLILFYFVNFIKNQEYIIAIFLFLFLIYLYLAMKKFYQQGYFKTFIKFILVNFSFLFVSTVGFILVTIIAFMMY